MREDGSLTIEKLRAAMEVLRNIPPAPFFASSRDLPMSKALMFKECNREYVGAHPDFWAKVPTEIASVEAQMLAAIGRIQIVDLDTQPHRKAEFYKALCEVMSGKSNA